jgi:uncharacterized membrane protein YgcG
MSEENPRSSQPGGWMARHKRAVLVAATLGVIGSFGVASAQLPPKKNFTADDVSAITHSLHGVDPKLYLIRVPVFTRGIITGSQVYGSLPMSKVERLAASLRVTLDRNANVLAVFDDGDSSGDTSGGGSESGGGEGGGGSDCSVGGGPGSHIPAQAFDLSNRINVLLRDIETSRYQFLR